VLEYGIGLKAGRVFADTWDIEQFSSCDQCLEKRKERLVRMNMGQVTEEKVVCGCNAVE
jgi:hypothetical protein